MLKIISENLALFSSIVTVGSAILASIFLVAYIGVFDRSMIWLVEYTDLIKIWISGLMFGVLAAIALTGLIPSIAAAVEVVGIIPIGVGVFFVYILLFVYLSVRYRSDFAAQFSDKYNWTLAPFFRDKRSGTRFDFLFQALSTALCFALLGIIPMFRYLEPALFQIISSETGFIGVESFVVVLFVYSSGKTLGFYVKNSSERYAITVSEPGKAENVFTGTRIVMSIGRFLILYTGNQTVAIPMENVSKIITGSNQKTEGVGQN